GMLLEGLFSPGADRPQRMILAPSLPRKNIPEHAILLWIFSSHAKWDPFQPPPLHFCRIFPQPARDHFRPHRSNGGTTRLTRFPAALSLGVVGNWCTRIEAPGTRGAAHVNEGRTSRN